MWSWENEISRVQMGNWQQYIIQWYYALLMFKIIIKFIDEYYFNYYVVLYSNMGTVVFNVGADAYS